MEFSIVPLVADAINSDGAARFQDAMATSDDWANAVIVSSSIIAGCALVAVIIWQVFLTARKSIEARADEKIREEMRALTQRAVASNESSAAELARVSQSVADVSARLNGIEKILREVE